MTNLRRETSIHKVERNPVCRLRLGLTGNWIGPPELAIFAGQRVSDPTARAVIDYVYLGPEPIEQPFLGKDVFEVTRMA